MQRLSSLSLAPNNPSRLTPVAEDPLLRSIDTKLNAILALLAEGHLRAYGSQRQQRARSLDRILTDAGVSAREVGKLLGKTERAVHLALQAEKTGTTKRARETTDALGD
jgi:hypothetical protein